MSLLSNPEQHDIDGWARRAGELDARCRALKAALREALDGWHLNALAADSEFNCRPEDDERSEQRIARITELRKFLDDK